MSEHRRNLDTWNDGWDYDPLDADIEACPGCGAQPRPTRWHNLSEHYAECRCDECGHVVASWGREQEPDETELPF